MEASPGVAEDGNRSVRRVERGHQGEDSHDEQNRRGERAQKTQARQYTNQQIRRHNGPGDKGRSLVKVVDRAAFEREAALDHGRRMENKRREQEEVVVSVVLAEALAPEEDRINHA